jgi:hypothetical protein
VETFASQLEYEVEYLRGGPQPSELPGKMGHKYLAIGRSNFRTTLVTIEGFTGFLGQMFSENTEISQNDLFFLKGLAFAKCHLKLTR